MISDDSCAVFNVSQKIPEIAILVVKKCEANWHHCTTVSLNSLHGARDFEPYCCLWWVGRTAMLC